MKKQYITLAVFNFVLSIVVICLYLPYTFEAFNMSGFDFMENILKDKYYDTLILFGIFLLSFIIVYNLSTMWFKSNLPKTIFKLTSVVALTLPLMYVLALRFDFMFKFWLKVIMPNIKMISYIIMLMAIGSFILGVIYNTTKRNNASLHIVVQTLFMCLLLILMIVVNNWCGFNVQNVVKLYGLLVGLFAIYLPLQGIILLFTHNKFE
ncbi:MAG: hypothetical protein ACLRFE_02510 [Clostridia bacterium]